MLRFAVPRQILSVHMCRRNLQHLYTREIHAHSSSSAPATHAEQPALTLISATPVATQLLAHFFASSLQPGDTYLLYGDVGSGKSAFSRAFIRAALQDENVPVPSPTFLLQNIYDSPQGMPIHHFDLYRLKDPRDLDRLDLPLSFSTAVSLLEWPGVLGNLTPTNHLEIRITILNESQQQAIAASQHTVEALAQLNLDEFDSEEDAAESGDVRWRRVEVIGRGQQWQQRLLQLQPHIHSVGGRFGMWEL